MSSHADLLNNMPLVQAALVRRYNWFIHTTPETNIGGIREKGLLANRDALAPQEVRMAFETDQVQILCLHPLGAKLWPRGAHSTLGLSLGEDEPKSVSFAIEACDLPQQIGLDWSYDWRGVEAAIRANDKMTLEELVVHLVNEYGSVAAYHKINPERLRVFCVGNSPTNPLDWKMLNHANDGDILRHD